MARGLIIAGLVFQVGGSLLVLRQIYLTERAFAISHWWTDAFHALRREVQKITYRLGFRPSAQTIKPVTASATASSSARARVRSRPGPLEGGTTEEQLAVVRRYLAAIDADLEEIQNVAERNAAQASKETLALEERVNVMAEDLKREVFTVALGTRSLQVLGALLVAFGVALATVGSLLL